VVLITTESTNRPVAGSQKESAETRGLLEMALLAEQGVQINRIRIEKKPPTLLFSL
jgi:hypothetical protein